MRVELGPDIDRDIGHWLSQGSPRPRQDQHRVGVLLEQPIVECLSLGLLVQPPLSLEAHAAKRRGALSGRSGSREAAERAWEELRRLDEEG